MSSLLLHRCIPHAARGAGRVSLVPALGLKATESTVLSSKLPLDSSCTFSPSHPSSYTSTRVRHCSSLHNNPRPALTQTSGLTHTTTQQSQGFYKMAESSTAKEVRKYLQQSHDRIFENNKKWADEMRKKKPEFFKDLSAGQSPEYLWIGKSWFSS